MQQNERRTPRGETHVQNLPNLFDAPFSSAEEGEHTSQRMHVHTDSVGILENEEDEKSAELGK